MEHLAARGITCPQPIHGRDGKALRTLAGKPAAITSFLHGLWPRRTDGRSIARRSARRWPRMHLAGSDFALKRPNALSVAGWRPLFDGSRAPRRRGRRRRSRASSAPSSTILEANWPTGPARRRDPRRPVPRQRLLPARQAVGLIDFYFACNDLLAYDVAICLNAWCFEPDHSFNATKARALLQGYERGAPTGRRRERAALPLLARGAALRFLLTRLYDWLHTPPGALVKRKDPLEYLRQAALPPRRHVAWRTMACKRDS